MIGYPSGMRNDRIVVYNRTKATVGKFGKDSAGAKYEVSFSCWASVTWTKGMRAMQEGALDAYGVVMVRMNYTGDIGPRSRVKYNDVMYSILPETFHADCRRNTIQFNAQAILDD